MDWHAPRRGVSFALLKYMRDVRRREPVNVGLIATDGEQFRLRFIGERDDGQVDGRSVTHTVRSVENFKQWVDYLRWRTEDRDFELRELLETRQGDPYIVEWGGQILIGPTDLDAVTDQLFAELVAPPVESQAREMTFQDRVEALLREAELFESPHFDTNQVVPIGGLERRFHYLWSNGSEAVGQRVPSTAPSDLDGIVFRFEHLASSYRRVLFVPEFTKTVEDTLREVTGRMTRDPTVLVVDEVEPGEVREAFTG